MKGGGKPLREGDICDGGGSEGGVDKRTKGSLKNIPNKVWGVFFFLAFFCCFFGDLIFFFLVDDVKGLAEFYWGHELVVLVAFFFVFLILFFFFLFFIIFRCSMFFIIFYMFTIFLDHLG